MYTLIKFLQNLLSLHRNHLHEQVISQQLDSRREKINFRSLLRHNSRFPARPDNGRGFPGNGLRLLPPPPGGRLSAATLRRGHRNRGGVQNGENPKPSSEVQGRITSSPRHFQSLARISPEAAAGFYHL